MRLGLLGGTFDPVHLGHLILAECARQQFGLDEVRFLVAGDPWRKWSTEVSPASHRIAMVRLAVRANAAFVVDTSEVERTGPTYTVETLTALRRHLAEGDELYFLMGEDALADMPYWREPERLPELAVLAVAPRGTGSGRESAAEKKPPPASVFPTVTIDMPHVEISSTDLRVRVRAGKGIRYLVPAAVEAYIVEHGLYGEPGGS